MEFTVQTGHRYNSKLYVVGPNVYVINKLRADVDVYLRCRHHQHCKGTAKVVTDINTVEELRPHTCESTAEDSSYLPFLEEMRIQAASTQQD